MLAKIDSLLIKENGSENREEIHTTRAIEQHLEVQKCCYFSLNKILEIVQLAENRNTENWCWTFSHFLS
jgi:hypothetical protein